jgi:hypothetical protein
MSPEMPNTSDPKPFVPFEPGMSFRGTAKDHGTCRLCGQSYQPSDHVNWNPRVKGSVCHAGCYAKYGSPTPLAKRSVRSVRTVPPPAIGANVALGATLAAEIAPYLESRFAATVTRDEVRDMVKTYVDARIRELFQTTISSL